MAPKSIQEYPEIMNIAEAAEFLRVHRTTIQRVAKSGELRSYLLGSRRLLLKRDLLAFFEKKVAR